MERTTPDTPKMSSRMYGMWLSFSEEKEATTAKNLYESSLIKRQRLFLNGSVLTDRKSLHKNW